MDDFISGEKLQGLCDCSIYPLDYLNSYPNIKKYIKKLILLNGKISSNELEIINSSYSFFIKTDYINYFANVILPFIKHPFILLTHNSDYRSGDNTAILSNEYLVKWYGSNIYITDKTMCLPIGLENSHFGNTNFSVCVNNRNNVKTELVYFNFSIETNFNLRKNVENILINKGFKKNTSKKWEDYIVELSKHKFCISPRGNGIDCHRHWEAIYVGCIPIVLNDAKDPIYHYFKHLPILFISDYSVITEDFLNEEYKKFNEKTFDLSMTTLTYWNKILKNNF